VRRAPWKLTLLVTVEANRQVLCQSELGGVKLIYASASDNMRLVLLKTSRPVSTRAKTVCAVARVEFAKNSRSPRLQEIA
jgi:hypothetical protein